MKLDGKKIAILFENDYLESEICYYKYRFAEEGAEIHFLTRLWGKESRTFYGQQYKVPMECHETFEIMTDMEFRSYSAVIVPSGMVADHLRYSDHIEKLSPAAVFLKRAFAEPSILKAFISHGLWLTAPIPEMIKGRKVTCCNSLMYDVKAYGANYVDEEIVLDGDLLTARDSGKAHLFAHQIINLLYEKERFLKGDEPW